MFFARFLGMDEADLEAWIDGRGTLPLEGEQALRGFWRMALHLLSFLNFDGAGIRELFRPARRGRRPSGPAVGRFHPAGLSRGRRCPGGRKC